MARLACRVGWCLAAAAIAGGCAAHRPAASTSTPTSLEQFVARLRELSAQARPARAATGDVAGTLEESHADLAAARVLLAASPTAENHRRVAGIYAHLGVLDAALDHFRQALLLKPRDAAAYDGRARIWRDTGFAARGLSDAYRALYYAPDSPEAENTLGTLLLKLGQLAPARSAFERALRLEPAAAYALNNLCYAFTLQARAVSAIAACREALRVQPGLAAARNNLGLAYGAAGDWTSASREFMGGADKAVAHFNMGVALMATRHFAAAAPAFDEASRLRPGFEEARARAEEARARGAAAETGVTNAAPR